MSEITTPYLSEHEAPGNQQGSTPGYNPTPDERKVIQLVDALYGKAKKYRKRYDQKWIDFYKDFRGRQWKEVRPSYRSSEVLNLIFETIQSMIPILVDSKPKLEFLPTVPSQFELADILSKVAANDWEHNNWLMTLVEIIYDSHFYGTAFGYVGFNPDAEMGLGSIEFESQDVFYVFPDPQARDINGKRTKHFITAEPVDIAQVKKEYASNPNSKYITADVIDFAQGDKADIYQVMFKSPTDSKLIVEGPSGYDSIAKNQTLKITVWLKDDDIEEEMKTELKEDGTPRLNPDGSMQTSYVAKKKYPKGRKICVAGGVLLDDQEIEFEDGNFPFVRLTNYTLPREFWGVGEVENLESPQKTINKILAYTLDCLALMGNPIYIVDDTSGIDTDNLFNKPGLVVEKTAGSEVRRESGVEMPSFVLPLLDRYKRYFDGISGQTDLSRGVEPGDITAASAIEDLQQAQQTRLRLKSKHIDAFLQDFGKLYLSRVFQFYSVPRIVRVSGDDNAQSYFYFHVERLEDGRKIANIMEPDAQGNAGRAKQVEITGDFDVKVSTGSTLPFAKEAKGEMALKLFQLGIIDAEEVLKDMDYPNYEAVLNRMQQKQGPAMQAQQQQVQLQQGETLSKIKKTEADSQKTQVEAAILAHQATMAQHAI